MNQKIVENYISHGICENSIHSEGNTRYSQ